MSEPIPTDLELTAADLARMAGDHSLATVASWIKRSPEFPRTTGTRGKAKLYSARDVAAWLQNHAPFNVQRQVSNSDLAVPLIHRAAEGACDPIRLAIVLCLMARYASQEDSIDAVSQELAETRPTEMANWLADAAFTSSAACDQVDAGEFVAADPDKLRLAAQSVLAAASAVPAGRTRTARALLQILDATRADRLAATTRWTEYRRTFVVAALLQGPVEGVAVDLLDPSGDFAVEIALHNELRKCSVRGGEPAGIGLLMRSRLAIAGLEMTARFASNSPLAMSTFPEKQRASPREVFRMVQQAAGQQAMAVLPQRAVVEPAFEDARREALAGGLAQIASFGPSRVRTADPITLWQWDGSTASKEITFRDLTALPFTDDEAELASVVAAVASPGSGDPTAPTVGAKELICGALPIGQPLRTHSAHPPNVARFATQHPDVTKLAHVALILAGNAEPADDTFGIADLVDGLQHRPRAPTRKRSEARPDVLIETGDVILGELHGYWAVAVAGRRARGRSLEQHCVVLRRRPGGPSQKDLSAWCLGDDFASALNADPKHLRLALSRLPIPQHLTLSQ